MEFFRAVRLVTCIIICEMAGAIGAFFTTPQIGGWYRTLEKPSFNPPSWIFGPVWTTIFVLMGISLFLVWDKKWVVTNEIGSQNAKTWNKWSASLLSGSWKKLNIVLIFSLQLFLNVLWSFIFFGLHNPGLAFFELIMLWVAIIFTAVNFYRVSKNAALLLVLYIVWVSFAAVLNLSIWLLN